MNVTIVGSGVVGKATGLSLLINGHDVLFYDIQQSAFADLPRFAERTTSWALAVGYADALILCVPTPPARHGECDLSTYWKTLDDFADNYQLSDYTAKTLIQKSTCSPGTADAAISRLIQTHGICRDDFNYLVWPEFLNSGTPISDAASPNKAIVGVGSPEEITVARDLLGWVPGDRLILLSYQEAEYTKYVNNLLHALLISFWNEIDLCAEQQEKISNSPIHLDRIAKLTTLEPGLESVYRVFGKAWGGACLPKDTRAFQRYADRIGVSTPILDALILINDRILSERGLQTKHWKDLHKD